MNPATINTILNTAPMILQGANKLIKLIRERKNQSMETDTSTPFTIEGLGREIDKLEARLDANDESDVEQIQLIEQLARQNEALAESHRRMFRRITLLTGLSIIAVAVSVISLVMLLIT